MDSIISRLPTWVMVVLLFYVAILVSYAVYDNRRVVFWPPAIEPRGPRSELPPDQLVHLKTFSQVFDKATKVIELAREELWMAVDVAAYGSTSLHQQFPAYRSALTTIVDRTKPNILWLSPVVWSSPAFVDGW